MSRDGARRDSAADEAVQAGEKPEDYVMRVTCQKVRVAWERVLARRGLRRMPVLAADTTVALANEIFGKPADRDDAIRMLTALAGTQHRVLTAVAVALEERVETALSISLVTLSPISPERIRTYVDSGEPFDKAGGYAIQGRAAAFAERIEGSYTGVMGLPLYETARLLREFGVAVP